MQAGLVETLIAELEAEVNNGGFDQFFFNSAGDATRETIDALIVIGAHVTAALVARAAAKFPGSLPPVDRNTRQDVLAAISTSGGAFELEDSEFYKYREDLKALADAYVAARCG